ncbi:MAG: hypothetical protein JWN55_2857 [Frankiales bacterium]|nr:hypothetical protein [Frankiales bacterium]
MPVRAVRLPVLVLPLLLAVGLLQGPAPVAAPVPVAAVAPAADPQPKFPIAASFFYPYYPVATTTRSRFHPNRPQGAYDSEVLRRQVDDMIYAGQNAAIYSWFGRGTFSDTVLPYHLRAADDTAFRWAMYYEGEGPSGPNKGNPTPAQIKVDLDHIYAKFGKDRNYLRVGGKPVLFVWGDAGDTCNASARWRAADKANRFYVVQKHLASYRSCNPQPNGWHAYAPANPRVQIGGSSYTISPGFNATRDKSPRLARSVSRFTADLKRMKAAKVQWRLTTTWNEWSEGTGVESATEWNSKSGHGAYVDAMHAVLGSAPGVPLPPSSLTATPAADGVQLAWSDVAGDTGYRVFRNGCQIGATDARTFKDTGTADAWGSYSVQAMNARGTARRSMVAIGAAGSPSPAPASNGEGIVALPTPTRFAATANGVGIGCAGRQRGEALIRLPAAVPADATAVYLAATAYNALGTGALQIGPAGQVPGVAQVRYFSNRGSTNTMVVPVGAARQISVRQSGAGTHYNLDVLGYAAPGAGGLTRGTGSIFYNSKTTQVSSVTVPLPAAVPADATAVQLKVFTNAAAGPGSAFVYPGGSPKPSVTQHSYAQSVMISGSVLVPVTGSRTVHVDLSSPARLFLGIEGWVTPGSSRLLTTKAGQRVFTGSLAAGATRVFRLPASVPVGGTALLNLGVAGATGYGGLTVSGTGTTAPPLPQVSYGPQQPQSGFALITVPANREVTLAMPQGGGAVYVDLVGTT